LYSRVVPTNAVEMTSAYLDRKVASILAKTRSASTSLQQKQELATVIHLCGAGAGESYALRGYRLQRHQLCGAHDAAAYVARVNVMKNEFARIRAREE